MTKRFLAVLFLAATVLSGSLPAFAQQVDTGPFLQSCYGNPNLLPMTKGDPTALENLCNCMAVDFAANVSAADLDVLRRDLVGELDEAERQTETYQALSAYASDAMSACLVIEGLEEGRAAPQQ